MTSVARSRTRTRGDCYPSDDEDIECTHHSHKSVADVLACYKSVYRPRRKRMRKEAEEHPRRIKWLVDAWRNNMHRHARWTKTKAGTKALSAWVKELQRRFRTPQRPTFARVHALVSTCSGASRRELSNYDLAWFIGASVGVSPGKWVYLHRGARKGAQAMGLPAAAARTRCSVAELSELLGFGAFARRSGQDMEDILCIYEADLLKIAKKKRAAQRLRRKKTLL